jgi:pectinesterase
LNRLIAAVKPGDFVMIQFGANDSGTVAGRHVEPAAFEAMYRTMAQEVKAKGGTAIFVTPSAFFQWSGTRQDNARLAPYSAAIKAAGAAEKVSVVDLNARGVEWLSSIGQTEARNFYMPNSQGVIDKAHFVKEGAVKMAGFVAEEVKKGGTPLGEYVK